MDSFSQPQDERTLHHLGWEDLDKKPPLEELQVENTEDYEFRVPGDGYASASKFIGDDERHIVSFILGSNPGVLFVLGGLTSTELGGRLPLFERQRWYWLQLSPSAVGAAGPVYETIRYEPDSYASRLRRC